MPPTFAPLAVSEPIILNALFQLSPSEPSLAQAHVPGPPAQNPAVPITVYHSHHPLTLSDNLGLWFTRFESSHHQWCKK